METTGTCGIGKLTIFPAAWCLATDELVVWAVKAFVVPSTTVLSDPLQMKSTLKVRIGKFSAFTEVEPPFCSVCMGGTGNWLFCGGDEVTVFVFIAAAAAAAQVNKRLLATVVDADRACWLFAAHVEGL